MDLSEDEVGRILRIVDDLDFTEVRLEIDDLKVHIVKDGHGRDRHRHEAPAVDRDRSEPRAGHRAVEAQAPVERTVSRDPEPAGAAAGPVASSDTAHIVRSPVSGVFYCAPEPGRDPFVAGRRCRGPPTMRSA